MAKSFKAGDHVEWGDEGDPLRGTMKRKLMQAYKIKECEVQASEDNAYYLIETDRTGAKAARKPERLRSVGDRSG